MASGWISSTIAFGAVVRHRRGVGRYRRTFAHVAFRQISRLAGVARFLPAPPSQDSPERNTELYPRYPGATDFAC
jgi:hypothetical protein